MTQHQLPEKMILFLNALQKESRIGVKEVSVNTDKEYITDYFIHWAGQVYNIWHNLHTNEFGWAVHNPFDIFN